MRSPISVFSDGASSSSQLPGHLYRELPGDARRTQDEDGFSGNEPGTVPEREP
jgi:hypothetical protein